MRKLYVYLAIIALANAINACTLPHEDYADNTRYYLLEDSTLHLSAQQALAIFNERSIQANTAHSFNPGFTKSYFWMLVQADTASPQTLLLQVGNAHLNLVEFYEVEDNTPVKRLVTGDHLDYQNRPLPSLDFVFPLNRAHRHYLLKIDKKNESMQLTFVARPAAVFWEELNQDAVVMGIMSGVIALMVLFGIYLFLMTRDNIYLFYVLYVVCGWLWVLANLGYGFKYLWPHAPWFASRARPVFTVLTMALSLQFIEYYTGKAFYRWQQYVLEVIRYISYALAGLFLIPFVEVSSNVLGYYAQAALPPLLGLYIIMIFLTLGQKAWSKNTMAMFYLSAFTAVILLTSVQLLHYSGVVDISGALLERYGSPLGYVAEAVVLTFGLAYRFNTYRNEREQLLVNINEQQVKYTRAIIKTQENERRQIADQLHDVAGSLLSAAKLNLSSVREKTWFTHAEANIKLAHAEEAVTSISDILRNLSHAISPVMLDKIGFRQSVEKIIQIFNAPGKIKFELDVVGFEKELPAMQEKYSVLYGILYELVNNVVKHAEAKNALIQLVEHEDSIVMTVEDNGKGLDTNATTMSSTHGLMTIQSKIHYLHGTVAFDKSEPHGLIVTIEIPTEGDEKDNTGR